MENNIKNKDSLKASMQTTGAGLVIDVWHTFESSELKHYCDDFSVIECLINNRWSMVIVKTAMIPNDPFYADDVQEMISKYYERLKNIYPDALYNYDIYYMGIRLTQTRVSQSEQHIYKIGGMYSGQSSPVLLIEKAKQFDYGYTIDNPIKMSEISDEYYFAKNVISEFGRIVDINRDGSYSGNEGNIIDKWSIMVEQNNQHYLYKIYMNPYALKAFENPFENRKVISGFELNEKKDFEDGSYDDAKSKVKGPSSIVALYYNEERNKISYVCFRMFDKSNIEKYLTKSDGKGIPIDLKGNRKYWLLKSDVNRNILLFTRTDDDKLPFNHIKDDEEDINALKYLLNL